MTKLAPIFGFNQAGCALRFEKGLDWVDLKKGSKLKLYLTNTNEFNSNTILGQDGPSGSKTGLSWVDYGQIH